MGINFINPYFLWGLPLVGVPIFLHFLWKRKAKVLKFSNLYFFKKISPSSLRKYRLKEILILLCRIFIIIFLTLLFCRPILEEAPLFAGEENKAVVFVIDNSYSMGYRDGEKDRFSLTKEIIIEIISDFSPSTLIGAITAQSPFAQIVANPTDDQQLVREKISKIKLSNFPTEIDKAIKKAEQILLPLKIDNKQIIVISDFAVHSFSSNEKLKISPEINLVLIKIGETKDNVCIKDVKLITPLEKIYSDTQLDFEVEVANYSEEQKNDFLIDLIVNEQNVYQGFCKIKPFSSSKKEVYYKLSKDDNPSLQFKIANDRLNVDDKFYLALNPLKKINVLIVDGEYSLISLNSEVYYLENALLSEQNSAINYKTVRLEEFKEENLSGYDLIIICNARIEQDIATKLIEFNKKGKGLIIFSGDNLNYQDYNNLLSEILPVKIFGQINQEKTIEFYNEKHPILAEFLPSERESLFSANFTSFIDCKLNYQGEILLSLNNNFPLLIEKKSFSDEGKVLFFTSSIDIEWNNLALKPFYLPLIYEMCYYTAGAKKQPSPLCYQVGENLERIFPVSDKISDITLNNQNLEIIQEEGKFKIRYKFENPGIYNLRYKLNNNLQEEKIAVNLNTKSEESNLRVLEDEEIKERFDTKNLRIIPYSKNFLEEVILVSQGKEISKFLGFLVLGLFILETILSLPSKNRKK